MIIKPANPDLFEHDAAAKQVWNSVSSVPIGNNIALIGGWGRGKTDVFSRLCVMAETDKVPVLHVSPWDSGHMDVLTGFAGELARKVDGKKQDKQLRALLKITSNLGSILCNRVVSAGIGHSFDIAEVGADLKTAFGEGDFRANEFLSPTQQASNSIKSLCELAYPRTNKIVVVIDDIDRCPPAWQRAIIESLHFLSHSGVPCVFVCALESRSVLRGTIDDPFNEMSSLVAKVFSIVHELHPINNELSSVAQAMMQSVDKIIGDTIENRLRYIIGKDSSYKLNTMGISQGMACANELATPRVIMGALGRLRAICLLDKQFGWMDLSNLECAKVFGFTLSIRERFPDMTEFLFIQFPELVRNLGAAINQQEFIIIANNQLVDAIDRLSGLQSQSVYDMFEAVLGQRRWLEGSKPDRLHELELGLGFSSKLANEAFV